MRGRIYSPVHIAVAIDGGYRQRGALEFFGKLDQFGPLRVAGSLGRKRRGEDVPLSEVVYALVLIKEHLRQYIQAVGLVDSAVELYLEEELHLMIGHFFDRAVYHTVKGYEAEGA